MFLQALVSLIYNTYIRYIHFQIWHFFSGFIALPTGQLKASVKFCEFETLPITLNRPGLCTSLYSASVLVLFFSTSHHNYNKLSQFCTYIKAHKSYFNHYYSHNLIITILNSRSVIILTLAKDKKKS